MLAEQRGRLAQSQAQLAGLEAEQAREGHLKHLGKRAARLAQYQRDTLAALRRLQSTLEAEIMSINAQRLEWAQCRQEAIDYAVEHLGLSQPYTHRITSGPPADWVALATLLTARGADGEALRYRPHGPERSDGSGFSLNLERPEHRSPDLAQYMRHYMAKRLDQPVSLTLAAAIQAAEQATPHEFTDLR